jgi:hypothetical protein
MSEQTIVAEYPPEFCDLVSKIQHSYSAQLRKWRTENTSNMDDEQTLQLQEWCRNREREVFLKIRDLVGDAFTSGQVQAMNKIKHLVHTKELEFPDLTDPCPDKSVDELKNDLYEKCERIDQIKRLIEESENIKNQVKQLNFKISDKKTYF